MISRMDREPTQSGTLFMKQSLRRGVSLSMGSCMGMGQFGLKMEMCIKGNLKMGSDQAKARWTIITLQEWEG